MTLRFVVAATVAALALAPVALVRTAEAADAKALERRCKSFYDLLARGQRTKATGLWPALERDVSGELDRLQTWLDDTREAVIDRDGDLEALYETQSWRDKEVAALVLEYHLAWVRYQGAQLPANESKRKQLLREAVDGFSKFTIVSDVPEIYAESLYGRGLAFMDLGQYGKAIGDLEAAGALPRTRRKASAALAEAKRLRAGGGRKAAPTPEELLGDLEAALVNAKGGSQKAEASALKMARGLAASGKDWPGKVDRAIDAKLPNSSFGLFIKGQIAVDRNRCRSVEALVTAGAAIQDAGRPRHRPELLYLHAGCAMNAKEFSTAATRFDALIDEFPSSAKAGNAAYYRFRALDSDPGADRAAVHAAGIEYTEKYGRTTRAGEVRFLLADSLRGSGDCSAARPLFEAVTAGPFAARAQLGLLECDVATLGSATPAEERARITTALQAFVANTPAKGRDVETVARAVLLAALVTASGSAPDHDVAANLLAGYEERFPEQAEWHAVARESRLESLIAAGRFTDARADVEHVIAGDISPETERLLARIANDLGRNALDPTTTDPDVPRDLARSIWSALAEKGTDPSARLRVAELELDAGNATDARTLFEAVLAESPDSAEARRGAARAAQAEGDTQGAMAHWRQIVEQSPSGGTAWYEARLAQIDVLVAGGHQAEACQVLRSSRGLSTTTGGDALERRLREREPEVCG